MKKVNYPKSKKAAIKRLLRPSCDGSCRRALASSRSLPMTAPQVLTGSRFRSKLTLKSKRPEMSVADYSCNRRKSDKPPLQLESLSNSRRGMSLQQLQEQQI